MGDIDSYSLSKECETKNRFGSCVCETGTALYEFHLKCSGWSCKGSSSEILGHTTTETTMTYLRIDINELRKCALEVAI